MRDDLDQAVADRFRLLDEVPVPDTWSKVQLRVRDDRPASSADLFELDLSVASPVAVGPTSGGRPRRGWMLAAAVVLGVVGGGVVFVERGSRQSTVVTTATPDATPAAVDSSFAAAMESAGPLISPSAEERALASNPSLYEPDEAWTQVSAAGNFVSLGKCRSAVVCGTSWAFMTGSVDGDDVYRGLLGEVAAPKVFVLDDRFFVAAGDTTNAEQPPSTWLIDSESGGLVQLTWRDDPTTLDSREQALLISDGHSALETARMTNAPRPYRRELLFLPRVVDGRDGTIRPLAVPDNASANLPVMQTGTGRIWIGAALDGREIGEEEPDAVHMAGVAYSDDGGATWTQVSVPSQLLEAERLATAGSFGLSIAADGDRIAIASAWSSNADRFVYVSDDAGLTWSVVTVANPSGGNGVRLYVLADKRLMLVRSLDVHPYEILVSTAGDWTTLERDVAATAAAEGTSSIPVPNYVSVNPDGTVLMLERDEDYTGVVLQGGETYVTPFHYHFSTDMRNWRTVPILDD